MIWRRKVNNRPGQKASQGKQQMAAEVKSFESAWCDYYYGWEEIKIL